MKTISVIIPVYNVEAYLPDCLDSVLKNKMQHLEILCINDGSTDRSGQILEEYRKKDMRIRVIHQKNRGVSAARNAGLEAAAGELIAFVDGDDWVHPRYFQILAEALEAGQADVVICGYVASSEPVPFREEITERRLMVGRDTMKDHTAKCYVWGRLYRREVLKNIRFREDMALGEDRAFHLELVCRNPELRVVQLSSKRYGYRQRLGSAVAGATADSWIRLTEDLLKGCGWEQTDLGKSLYLTESIKLAFSVRNQCGEDPARLRKSEMLVDECVHIMKTVRSLPLVRRVGYWLMARYQWIYRLLLWAKMKSAGSD